jgi:transcriptional regulator with XRE-family HTH domain
MAGLSMVMTQQADTLEGAFGKTLRQLREKKGLSQEELADQCHIHRTYVSQLERGLKSPTLRLMWQICESLEADPLALITEMVGRLPPKEIFR